MFKLIHKIKPAINFFLKISGLYVPFHIMFVKLFSKRNKLSKKYIKGKGIEVGALHTPLKVFNKAKVVYSDRMNNKDLLKHYPELKRFNFVKVGLVDDGEKLSKVKTDSQDFVIANHFIEHCENPIKTLKNHLRILKKGGIIYWAIPDKRFTFDSIRKTTSLSHVVGDYEKGALNSRKDHYDEWAKVILNLTGKDAKKKSNQLRKELYSIHFHTYTRDTFRKMLKYSQAKLNIEFEIVDMVPNINEFIVILKKK